MQQGVLLRQILTILMNIIKFGLEHRLVIITVDHAIPQSQEFYKLFKHYVPLLSS